MLHIHAARVKCLFGLTWIIQLQLCSNEKEHAALERQQWQAHLGQGDHHNFVDHVGLTYAHLEHRMSHPRLLPW